MKIGFFDTCLEWVPHFETDLELMDLHIKKGDEVVWFNCNSELPFCQPNPLHKKNICKSCIKRKEKGLALYKEHVVIKNWNSLPLLECTIPDITSINELKEVKYKDFDIGLATVSSLVSIIREPNPDMAASRNLWGKAFIASFNTFNRIYEALIEGHFDIVYIFNGRYAVERAVMRACSLLGIKFIIHERGRNKDHYMLYENSLPHNRAAWVKRMYETWNDPSISKTEKEKIGHAFYSDRTKGKEEFWISFVHSMKEGYLPENFSKEKTNITIFTSSEDEMISISDEWKNPVYNSQLEGIRAILEDAPKDYQFYLRLHPNLTGLKSNDVKALLLLQYQNLSVIPPDSKVNTYALIKASDKVISFGSTVGIEATYWGVPSILAGVSYYHGTNATYDASSHEMVVELLQKDLSPKDKEPALVYGYFLKTFGYKFVNYQGIHFYLGRYKGRFLYGNFLNYFVMRMLISLSLIGPLKRTIKKLWPYSSRVSQKM